MQFIKDMQVVKELVIKEQRTLTITTEHKKG